MAEPNSKPGTGTLAMGVDADGLAQFMTAIPAASIGTPSDTAWDGVTADPTMFALLKAIAINTAPAAP